MDHCCEMMESNLDSGETAIRYVARLREYGIPVLDGGNSHIQIKFCPWCGKRLPESLREAWFHALEAKGLAVGDSSIPADLMSDQWWKSDKMHNR